MKAIRNIWTAIALAGVIIGTVSCSKEKPSATEAAKNKILGKWKLQTVVSNSFNGGVNHISNRPDTSNQIMEFRNDGQVVYTDDHSLYESYGYGFSGPSSIWINVLLNFWDLKVLTDTDLQLYQKWPGPYSSYEETTFIYHR